MDLERKTHMDLAAVSYIGVYSFIRIKKNIIPVYGHFLPAKLQIANY